MPLPVQPKQIEWERLKSAPWERLPGERDSSWALFRMFRDMPPLTRSQTAVARQTGRSRYTLNEIAQRWHWRFRVEAYDRYLDALARQEQLEAIKEMADRHARTAVAMLSLAARRLVGDGTVEAIDPSRLSPLEVARLIEIGTKVEAIARGAASERVQLHTSEEINVKVGFEFNPSYDGSPAVVDALAKRADTPAARRQLESGLLPLPAAEEANEAE